MGDFLDLFKNISFFSEEDSEKLHSQANTVYRRILCIYPRDRMLLHGLKVLNFNLKIAASRSKILAVSSGKKRKHDEIVNGEE